MAHNERPGPLPPHDAAGSIPRMYNRFAKRDPQLYPLAGIMAVTLGVAGYFLAIRKPQQVDPKGQGDSTIQQQRAALKDSSKGDVSLEGFKAGTIPSGDVGQTAGVTKTVSLSPGADPKVQARQG